MSENSKEEEKKKIMFKDLKSLILITGMFYTLAIVLWLVLDIFFYLVNFVVIGTALGLGIGSAPLFSKKKRDNSRKISQILMGGYMFFGLGFGLIYIFGFGYIQPENMQFEGFWFYLFAGVFAAATLHYLIAKILGPFYFNRGWCGYACWTAAVLDLLPWKKSPGRIKKLGGLRYVHFLISFILILFLVFLVGYTLRTTEGLVNLSGDLTQRKKDMPQYNSIFEIPEFWWFFIGSIFYFLSGIILAAILKDNRAFCKYLCPITVFLKVGGKYSMIKIEGDPEKCTQCKACNRVCPMDIDVAQYVENNMRVTSSECILCNKCVNVCPSESLQMTVKRDKNRKELLLYKE